MRPECTSPLDARALLTSEIQSSPYNPEFYLDRARCHEELGFADLAAGDAYKALLLTDEVRDESGEYHEQAIEALKAHRKGSEEIGDNKGYFGHAVNENVNGKTKADALPLDGYTEEATIEEENKESVWEETARLYARQCFKTLARTLLKCGCLKSAYDFSSRGLSSFPLDRKLRHIQDQILETNRQNQLQRDPAWSPSNLNPKTDLLEQGSVRRELYPWNSHETDRFSESSLTFLCSEMLKVTQKCEVRAVSLPLLQQNTSSPSIIPAPTVKQLGIFTTADIAPYETVLHESSLLTANNRLHDPLCDACSSALPTNPSSPLPTCPDCVDVVFCSSRCQTAALELYHPALCSKPDLDTLARDPCPSAAANALYLLLLARAFALAFTQDTHPLDLPETKFLWGDFIPANLAYAHSSSASAFATAGHLPFTFHDNILAPLHMLEKMDIDVFAEVDRCDTWVLNTLFAKFRGTASGRVSTRDGRPEVCAVHPMWSLANHSCAPNVKWKWGGEIRFEARGGDEVIKWGNGKGKISEGGIKKGEEVLNHYCDVELPVKERREWAMGALGGMCLCERCVWEEGEEREGIAREGEGGGRDGKGKGK